MNDETVNPLHELASAYLDGDVSAGERARVEGSEAAQELVESFRRLRAELADAPPASAAVREAAIAAALNAFDGQRVVHAAPTAPVVHLASRGRPRWPALLLSAAAAAAVVGVVGSVVLNNRDGSDGTASKTSEQFSTEANRAVTADSMPPVSTIGSISGPASAVPVISTASELIAFAPAMPEVAPVGGASSTTAATDAQTSDGVGARGCPLGENQIVVGDIIWIDIPAVAVRDTVSGVVQAIDDQCNVLVAAEP